MRSTTTLRTMLREGRQVVAPGAWDALSARAIAGLGFDAVEVGGFATAAALGTLEPLMTMTEQVEVARRVAQAVEGVPVIVDAHTGYGEPVHVTRAIRELEAAGVAAVHVEDQIFPKRASYHRGIKRLVPVEEMQGRIRAACRARRDEDLMVIASTDARGAAGGSLEEVIVRMRAYAEAGADALMPMPHGREEAARVREAVPGLPMVWLAAIGRFGNGREIPLAELREIGYDLVLFSVVGLCRAIDALVSLCGELRRDGVVDVARLDDQYERIMQLVGAPAAYALEDATTERGGA